MKRGTHVKQSAVYRLLFAYIVAATFLFGVLAVLTLRVEHFPGDVEITRAIQSFRSPPLDLVMMLVTLPGSPPQTFALNVLLVLIPLVFRLKAEAITLLIFIPTFGTVSTWFRLGINRRAESLTPLTYNQGWAKQLGMPNVSELTFPFFNIGYDIDPLGLPEVVILFQFQVILMHLYDLQKSSHFIGRVDRRHKSLRLRHYNHSCGLPHFL